MQDDPRDKPRLTEEDLLNLNFIRRDPSFIFRRHHRSGLRSHLFQVLDPMGVQKERDGVLVDGLRTFPRAKPIKMLRIFRTRFKNRHEAEEEVKRVKSIETFLAPHHLARSNEFLVDLIVGWTMEPILCGLQEYVTGESIDPWSALDKSHLASLLTRISPPGIALSDCKMEAWIRTVREKALDLIHRLKKLIAETDYVPDLAGSGNLLLTLTGHIKLVDINNISRVSFDSAIPLDDRGYPVCDKSIEALYLLEEKLLLKPIDRSQAVYSYFLDPTRMERVRELEREFHMTPPLDFCSDSLPHPASLSSYPKSHLP
jgi:hypothetical protein